METIKNTNEASQAAASLTLAPKYKTSATYGCALPPMSGTFCPWQAAGWESPACEDEAKREAIKSGTKHAKRADLSSLASAGSPSLAKVARTIIRRINYPKAWCGKQALYKKDTHRKGVAFKAGEATKGEREKSLSSKSRPLLSSDDECEIFQTVALVMVARGILASDSLTGEDWKALFRASRATLGIDKARSGEVSTSPDDAIFTLLEAVRSGYDSEAVALARVKLAKRLRYWHSCISKAREVSISRQKKHAWKNQLATLRKIAAGNLTFSGMSHQEIKDASKARLTLIKAVDLGEAAFDSEAESEATATRNRNRAFSIKSCMVALW